MGIKRIIVGGRTDVKKVTLDGATIYEQTGGLPSDYQRCAYVASPGAPYISLPWHFAGTARLEIGVKTGNATVRICGIVENSGKNRFSLTRTSNTGITAYFTSNGAFASKSADVDLNYHDFVFDVSTGEKPEIYVDGTLAATAGKTADAITTINPFVVFGEWYNTGRRHAGTMELYYLRIYGAGGALEVELVPCYRKADGEIGLYDLCGLISTQTGTPFFTNEGTGAFTKGADV